MGLAALSCVAAWRCRKSLLIDVILLQLRALPLAPAPGIGVRHGLGGLPPSQTVYAVAEFVGVFHVNTIAQNNIAER